MARLTGERPLRGSTPDSLLALHGAGYREVAARLGPGVVLDIGCGAGEETARLGGPDRFVVGADYHAPTAVAAGRGRTGDPVAFAAMDGARLALASDGADFVCSSHIIEHFTNPERHVAEVARVLAPTGTAFFLTPNAPADFENPFHVFLFEAAHLASLLRLFFADVEVVGLNGSALFAADFAARRASGDRILRLDFLRLRHHLPRRAYVWAYERALPFVYRLLGPARTGVGSGLDESHLQISSEITAETPVLFATARRPRMPRG